MAEENIVIKKVLIDSSTVDWGRDNLSTATEFCRRPKYPAHHSDSFIGVDDWGHGNIVCATPDLSNWIGHPFKQFKTEAH